MPTYHIETLGCKLNFSESATMGKLLEDAGYRRATAGEEATVCVVNTCSVTDLADRKCRQHIRALLRRHPGTVMVVTGCYAQLKAAASRNSTWCRTWSRLCAPGSRRWR